MKSVSTFGTAESILRLGDLPYVQASTICLYDGPLWTKPLQPSTRAAGGLASEISDTVMKKAESSMPGPAMNDEMRDRIIEASVKYMKVHGSQKLSMVDVARTAGISRATVYNYFDSKETLIEAAQQALDSVFFGGLNTMLTECKTLTEQVSAIAIFIRQSWTDRNHTPWYGFLSPLDEAKFLASKASEHTQIMIDFVRPFVQKAKKSGEIRADADIGRATEWIARIIMSFAFSSPSPKMDNPREIKRLFNDFLMQGLASAAGSGPGGRGG